MRTYRHVSFGKKLLQSIEDTVHCPCCGRKLVNVSKKKFFYRKNRSTGWEESHINRRGKELPTHKRTMIKCLKCFTHSKYNPELGVITYYKTLSEFILTTIGWGFMAFITSFALTIYIGTQ